MSGGTALLQVLVLDDDKRVCEAVCLALRDSGFTVFGTTDIETALTAIANATPSVVVTDLQMAGSEGAAVVGLLRRRFPEIQVVAMSGDHDLANEALALGAKVFLRKPLRRGAMASHVGALVHAAA